MEDRLAEYRKQKEREWRAQNSFSNKLKSFLFRTENSPSTNANVVSGNQDSDSLLQSQHQPRPTGELRQRQDPSTQEECLNEHSTADSSQGSLEERDRKKSDTKIYPRHVKAVLGVLFFLLWLCVWGIFIELEFGAVFFIISVLVFIYFNTGTGPKKENELSAYSVFNKNFETIQGTVTAEKLQNEMFRVPG